jgi:hypothetical protein
VERQQRNPVAIARLVFFTLGFDEKGVLDSARHRDQMHALAERALALAIAREARLGDRRCRKPLSRRRRKVASRTQAGAADLRRGPGKDRLSPSVAPGEPAFSAGPPDFAPRARRGS